MSNDEIVARAGQSALENDRVGGCSQAVLGALQEHLGLGGADSFKAATVLSAGVARRGETCGALIGALMAFGIAEGRDMMADTAAYARAMSHAQSIIDGFMGDVQSRCSLRQPLDTTLCRDIQRQLYQRSFDLTREDERQAFLDAGGHDDNKCPLICAVAAEAAARAILALRRAD